MPTAASPDPGACTERELTAPVDECLPDGRLNPAALGWSRHPLQRGNLRGSWGRNKRWDYWCVTSPTHLFSVTYSHIDYAALLTVWFLEFGGREVERTALVPLGRGVSLPDTVGGGDLVYDRGDMRLALLERPGGTRLLADVGGPADARLDADVFVAQPPGHESLNVMIPWSERRFQFTSKHNTRPAQGVVRVDGDEYRFGPGNDSWAALDVGRGRWRYRTVWNWGSASGHTDGRLVGLQFGGRWTDGTGATENALCIDGRLHKLSEELVWEYSTDDYTRPWHISTPRSNRVDLEIVPFHERVSVLRAVVIGSEVHQCFGHYRGRVVTDDGDTVSVGGLLGWAEEARMRW